MAAGAGQRAAGSSRSSSRSGGRLMAGAGSRPPGCGQSAGGDVSSGYGTPPAAPRRARRGRLAGCRRGARVEPAALPVVTPSFIPTATPRKRRSAPLRRNAARAACRATGRAERWPLRQREGRSPTPPRSVPRAVRRSLRCRPASAPRPPPPASSGTHLGSARLGPVPHGSAPRRGSAGGRRGGPGGAGRGRAAGGGPGVHARADTCKHARARGHLRAPADAPASARTRAYAGVPSAPVHTRTRTCKCRRASAHARPYVNKRKWMHTPAHTCKRTRTAPPATRTPCSSTQGTAAALAARRRTPCPHARCVCTEARTLYPNGRPTHARLPCPPPPSTCHRVRCHRPERPPCHPGATRRARPRAAAVSRARGGGRGGPRSAAAQMSGAGPGCSKQNSCAASHFPAFAAKNSKCREVPAAAVPGGGGRGGTLPGPPRSRPSGGGWVLAALRGDEDAASRVAPLQDFARGASGREAGPGRARHGVPVAGCGGGDAPIPRASLRRSRAGDVPRLQRRDVARWQPAAGASSSAGPASGGPTCRSHQASHGRGRVPEKQRQSCQGRAGPEGGCHVAAAPPLPPPALHQLPRDGDGWAGDGSRDGTVCPWISPPVPRNAGMHRFSARLLLSAQFCLRSPGRPQRRALSVQCEGASRGQPPLLSPAGSNRDRQRQPLPGGGTRGPGWGLVQPEAAGPQPRGGCGGDGTRRDARCALGTQQGRGAPLPGGRLPASWAGSFGSGTGMRHAGTPLGSAQPPLGPSPRG